MATIYDRLVAALKATADAGSDALQKILYGTPGSYVQYPTADPTDEESQTYDTGRYWSGSDLPPLLTEIGAELDRAMLAWGYINTNATGVAPTVVAGSFISSATKNEGSKRVTVNFSPEFANANYFVTAQLYLGLAALPDVQSQAVGNAVLRWYDDAGAAIDVNNLVVLVLACGQG